MSPMTPAVAGPQWMPTRSLSFRPPSGGWRSIDLHHRQREPTDRHGAGGGRATVKAARRHVAVADGLDLVDPVALAQLVERAHQPIEKVDDLLGGKVVRRRGEAREVGEHDAEHLDPVGDALFASRLQPRRDRLRHDRRDQSLGARMLVLQRDSRRDPGPRGRRR